MSVSFRDRDIISITDFSREEILHLCAAGNRMAEMEKSGQRNKLRDALKHRTLSSMFYEPSTRTRTSFNTGMRELGGRYDGFSGTEGTSVMKNETVRDTVTMMCANHNDVIVMRHPLDGSLQWAADVANIPVINGGDGKNEHPTQALLDMLTIYALRGGRMDGLRVGFGGDLSHGRTVRSLSLALAHFDGVKLLWAAEDFLGMPEDLAQLLAARGVSVQRVDSVRDVMRQVDFYYMTRPQLERMPGVTQKDILTMMKQYRIDLDKVKGFDARVLHPLPVNSAIAEIDYPVYFTQAQAFFAQAEYGIFLRKALLHEMLGHDGYRRYDGRLAEELGTGNNRLARGVRGVKQSTMFIDKIHDGTVIDHLVPGTLRAVSDALDLENRGYSCTTATIAEKPNPFIKTNMPELPERDLKRIALLSPEPTIDYVQDGRIAKKFVYLLCTNPNCITRTVNEDVPPRFYKDGHTIRCRYCRRPHAVVHRKVSAEEMKEYLSSLPSRIEPVVYPGGAMIDPHVHLRDGSQAAKETLAHGLSVAWRAGLDGVFEMPNTDPPLTTRDAILRRIEAADAALRTAGVGLFHGVYAGITAVPRQIEEAVKAWRELFPRVVGLKMFAGHSTGNMGLPLREEQALVYRMLAALGFTGVLAVHCEKESLLRPADWDPAKPVTHAQARPPAAEVASVDDQLQLASRAAFKGTLHVCHVSTPWALDVLRGAHRGETDEEPAVRVTCGLTPHHALLDANMLEEPEGMLLKVNPPLRPRPMPAMMLQRLLDGKIDWVESDHAPHTRVDKLEGFASGIPGLPFLPVFLGMLAERGFPAARIRELSHDAVCRVFAITLKASGRQPELDLAGEYPFDPFSVLVSQNR